jgi:uncharacterized protein involved in exopolysaccharide biosynthesis
MGDEHTTNLPTKDCSDEIDLIQLFQTLLKYKWMIVAVTVLITVAAAAGSMMMPKVYKVSTIIDLGRDSRGKFIEPEVAIRENIVAGVYDQEIAKKMPLSTEVIPPFKVSILKGSSLMKITTMGSEPEYLGKVLGVLSSVVLEKNQKFIDEIISSLKLKLKPLNLQDELLTKKIDMLQDIVKQDQKKIDSLRSQKKDQLTRSELLDLKFLFSELTQMKLSIMSLYSQKQLVQFEMEKVFSAKKLDHYTKGMVVKEPVVPHAPIKPRKRLIVALAFVLGLMGSVMLVFFVEFLSKVREEQQH